ncbi:MAG: 1-deoxy-D-xylulose-5-phosphate synthase [Actinobacteria bacterium]|jgi:1-deoxy-D-xylulose-5-phosphate synthase|nr:1-deoxy-D-xylulose-5-phosphate synthase [Actinomycetota bacterium]
MILEKIKGPQDVRALDERELVQLCEEIRKFIVDTVTETGGHLGSNLGIVEITIALHRVFNSPRDIILFDTGHQAYVHKLLTGRMADFPYLRKAGGLSGYPSRKESPHDWIENSHASTALSYAYGLSTALELGKGPTVGDQLGGEPRTVVAIVGDGALTGGLAYEALNNIGHSGKRVVIIWNDNGRSYAPTVSKLSSGLTRLRLNPSYMQARSKIKQMIAELPAVGGLAVSGIAGITSALREVIEPKVFFESLGVRYTGPIEGHDVAAMEYAFKNAESWDGPIVIHVLTQKGRGYGPAEDDEIQRLHDLKVLQPTLHSEVEYGSYTDAFSTSLVSIAEKTPEVVAITAAMPGPTGLLAFEERFPERFFDVGIAEAHAVTAAAGMAMGNLRPVVAIYSTFISRALDQVNLDVGLHRVPVVFVLDRAGITGDDGPSHHGVLDLVEFLAIPGMTVLAPSSLEDIDQMLNYALTLAGPSMIRFPKTPGPKCLSIKGSPEIAPRELVTGNEVGIVAVGKMVEPSLRAAELLAESGISASVWDPRILSRFDGAYLARLRDYRFVATIEDGFIPGGYGSHLRYHLENTPHKLELQFLELGVPVGYLPHGKADDILSSLGLNAEGIAKSIASSLAQIV